MDVSHLDIALPNPAEYKPVPLTDEPIPCDDEYTSSHYQLSATDVFEETRYGLETCHASDEITFHSNLKTADVYKSHGTGYSQNRT